MTHYCLRASVLVYQSLWPDEDPDVDRNVQASLSIKDFYLLRLFRILAQFNVSWLGYFFFVFCCIIIAGLDLYKAVDGAVSKHSMKDATKAANKETLPV